MLKLLPEKVTHTLEFGCSNGNFSKLLKEKYNAETWGVDMDPKAIENAKRVLDKAILGEAMEALETLPKEYFDCVICNDFLEHIPSPEKLIIALKPYVKDNAILICSLPNVRFWKNLKELILEKDWRYREAGILDSTHLRFFTKKSMIRLITTCGLKMETIEGINPSKSLRFLIPNMLTFGIHNDMKYLQFVIRARF